MLSGFSSSQKVVNSAIKNQGFNDVIAVASGKGGVGKSTTAGEGYMFFLPLLSMEFELILVFSPNGKHSCFMVWEIYLEIAVFVFL